VELVLARVPELVRRAGLDPDDVTRAELELLAGDLEADRPRDDLEALGLDRVVVGGRDRAVRLHVRVERRQLAVRLGGRGAEDEALAGHRVLDRVTCVEHSFSFVQPSGGGWFRWRERYGAPA
jgi:hypothetical protein